ncbi:7731_t:CDS:2 [Ambispora leptoticha]|uniref:7731_t:CDS:1 n=1 Tax=Ambispora leptoticha TaxID=144679 RepID=A0A9N9BTA1_9GLOM|nr:7731_t:CDS:2 [Ambispora leptoticha]
MSEPNTTQNTILIPPDLYYKEYWLNTSFQDWSIESFDMFWIQQNPTLHQSQDRAHTSLGSELKILSKASDQRVAEKALLLQKLLKCKKSAEIIDIIWDRSEEIADSKVRLTLSELLTKTKVKTNIVSEIGDLGSSATSK